MNGVIGYAELKALLADGCPPLVLDRLEIARDGQSAAGIKAISAGDAFFQGHFPGHPIMPGVLQMGAMAQLSGAVLHNAGEIPGDASWWLVGVHRVKFRRPVLPGAIMRVETAINKRTDEGHVVFDTKTIVDDQIACSAHMTLATLQRSDLLASPAELVPEPKAFEIPEDATVAEAEAIEDMIPHRFPFKLVDRVTIISPERALGVKNVTGTEWFFENTTLPVMPLNLQIEAAAQTACAVTLSQPENKNKLGFFMSIDEATWESPVLPGDQIVFDVNINPRGRFGIAGAKGYVGNRRVSHGVVKFAIVDRES